MTAIGGLAHTEREVSGNAIGWNPIALPEQSERMAFTMPTRQASTTIDFSNPVDYRIFGFDQRGQLQANLYVPNAGALYSWVTAPNVYALADKLEQRWEQPLSDAEWDAIQELLDSQAETVCETCGGTGADPGAIDPFGEPCPDCSGAVEMLRKAPQTVPALRGFGRPLTGRTAS